MIRRKNVPLCYHGATAAIGVAPGALSPVTSPTRPGPQVSRGVTPTAALPVVQTIAPEVRHPIRLAADIEPVTRHRRTVNVDRRAGGARGA